MRPGRVLRFLLIRLALAMPFGRLLGPRLLGLALGTWPRAR
jgi:hypothetical protein